jgi:hypothetical protein
MDPPMVAAALKFRCPPNVYVLPLEYVQHPPMPFAQRRLRSAQESSLGAKLTTNALAVALCCACNEG